MRCAFDSCVARQRQGIGENVGHLPEKDVIGHAQQRLVAPVRKDHAIIERLSAQVHVRVHAHHAHIVLQCKF